VNGLKSFALLAFFVSSLFARVGETEAQLVSRFGPPIARVTHKVFAQGKWYELGPTLTFKQEGWQMACDLVDGRCVKINYQKTGEWTDEQFQTVLNANSQGEKWIDLSVTGAVKIRRKWKRSDGAVATWTMRQMDIIVPAYERAKAIVEAKAKADANRRPKI
jgi:hypothetical protein